MVKSHSVRSGLPLSRPGNREHTCSNLHALQTYSTCTHYPVGLQVDVTMPDGTLLLSEEFATYLPVKWASKDGLSPRRSEVHVSEGRPGHMSAGGASPIVMGRRAQGQGGQVRRASYSSPAAEAPLSLPFQRATRYVPANGPCTPMPATQPAVQY